MCSRALSPLRPSPLAHGPLIAGSMDRPTLTVADVFRRHGETSRAQAGPSLPVAHRRVMTAIETCRTAARGGHVEPCDRCPHTRIWYSSCRNRHCPTCQSLARAAWIEDRTAALLDTEYFHCRVHRAPGRRRDRLAEHGGGLRHPLSRHRGDPPHHRRGSAPSRRRDRRLRRPAHLGTDARPPSAAVRHPSPDALVRRVERDELTGPIEENVQQWPARACAASERRPAARTPAAPRASDTACGTSAPGPARRRARPG